MYIYSLANANASVITVTNTATKLYDLLDTAGSAANNLPGHLNAVDLVVESGSDVRILFDGNSPTSSKGILLSQGALYSFRGVPLTQLRLIRTGSSNASVSVQVGLSQEGESSSAAATSVTLEATDIEIGAVELKNGEDDGRAIINDANTARVATDNVLLVQAIDATGAVVSGGSSVADDSAFTPTTSKVSPVGFFADETATDSVEEGDVGAPRMTLDRKIITAGSFKEDTAHTDADYGVAMLSKRTDTAASSAGTDGDYATINTDSLGHQWIREGYQAAYEDNSNAVAAIQIRPIAASAYSPLLYTNLAAAATANVKATAGNVFSVKCHNLNAATRYFQLHNTATTPGGGAVPLLTFTVPSNTEVVIGNDFFSAAGLHFTTGIAFAFSTTEGTYTAGASTDQFSAVTYI